MSTVTPGRRTVSYATLLVVTTALAGVVACILGAVNWGILGISVGLAGTWALFLLGLTGLYHRHQRGEQQNHRGSVAVAEAPQAVHHSHDAL
jgi:hypothetical protein